MVGCVSLWTINWSKSSIRPSRVKTSYWSSRACLGSIVITLGLSISSSISSFSSSSSSDAAASPTSSCTSEDDCWSKYEVSYNNYYATSPRVYILYITNYNKTIFYLWLFLSPWRLSRRLSRGLSFVVKFATKFVKLAYEHGAPYFRGRWLPHLYFDRRTWPDIHKLGLDYVPCLNGWLSFACVLPILPFDYYNVVPLESVLSHTRASRSPRGHCERG